MPENETTAPSTGDATASGQAPADRPLPAMVPPTPGAGLQGVELPESMRSAAATGLFGASLAIAADWAAQQTKELGAGRDENRDLRTKNERLTNERADLRTENAVLRNRLATRWITQAAGQLGAIALGAAITMYGADNRLAVILTIIGLLLLVISWIDQRRST